MFIPSPSFLTYRSFMWNMTLIYLWSTSFSLYFCCVTHLLQRKCVCDIRICNGLYCLWHHVVICLLMHWANVIFIESSSKIIQFTLMISLNKMLSLDYLLSLNQAFSFITKNISGAPPCPPAIILSKFKHFKIYLFFCLVLNSHFNV